MKPYYFESTSSNENANMAVSRPSSKVLAASDVSQQHDFKPDLSLTLQCGSQNCAATRWLSAPLPIDSYQPQEVFKLELSASVCHQTLASLTLWDFGLRKLSAFERSRTAAALSLKQLLLSVDFRSMQT
ncbi:hypothetical protein J6590_053453 [Homalodisca vitripennis]|nr:hypothetical protein J6590_053453 [Homalodisca vitripennis]